MQVIRFNFHERFKYLLQPVMIGFFGGLFIEGNGPGFPFMRLVQIFCARNMACVFSSRGLGKTQDLSPDCGVLGLDFRERLEQQLAFRIIGFFRRAEIKRGIAHLDLNGVLCIGPVFLREWNLKGHHRFFGLFEEFLMGAAKGTVGRGIHPHIRIAANNTSPQFDHYSSPIALYFKTFFTDTINHQISSVDFSPGLEFLGKPYLINGWTLKVDNFMASTADHVMMILIFRVESGLTFYSFHFLNQIMLDEESKRTVNGV
jgi:hypothetical protein